MQHAQKEDPDELVEQTKQQKTGWPRENITQRSPQTGGQRQKAEVQDRGEAEWSKIGRVSTVIRL